MHGKLSSSNLNEVGAKKVDEVKYFDNEEEANQFVRKFNSQNTAGHAPDWYMYAESPQRVN